MHIPRPRILWLVIVLLAGFVLFIQCLAVVGGDPDAIRHPTMPNATAPPVN